MDGAPQLAAATQTIQTVEVTLLRNASLEIFLFVFILNSSLTLAENYHSSTSTKLTPCHMYMYILLLTI